MNHDADLANLAERQPLVLLGAGGMLHRAWTQLLNSVGVAHVDLSPREIEFTDPRSIDAAVTERWRMVINCAAYTDVDAAESNESLAMTINATAVGRLAQRCREVGGVLVHYSTDYVFDGRGARPYATTDRRSPVGVYARSKAIGEEMLEQSGCEHLIIRTSWLYAPWGRNFVRTIAALAASRPTLRVVSDQVGRPTSAEHLARTSLRLLAHRERGIRHVTDGGQCSWFDFATAIAAFANPNCRVEPCTTSEFPRPAPRPAYSVLDLSETERLLGPMPPWQTNLTSVLSRLEMPACA